MIIGVIGSGAIGPDLAYGFISALAKAGGGKVYLLDIKKEALEAGSQRIQGYVKKGLSRGKLAPKVAKAVEAGLVTTMDMKDLADCDYVLEAATEDLPIKRSILRELEGVVGGDCLIGFATSGIPRSQIAAEAKHPQRCFVNHPFFPAWRSLPIEVVLSEDDALAALRKLNERQCQVVEMRFFGGLSVEETAHALGVSPRTVNGEWHLARAWLRDYLDR